ncbi:MAG: response regulator [Chitinivibrionales bacterium]|nr:response regulator [Chitinivibrionales bacterium]
MPNRNKGFTVVSFSYVNEYIICVQNSGNIFLAPSFATVIAAKNGDEAISCYRNNRDDTDLVLRDLILPEMSGLSAIYRASQN